MTNFEFFDSFACLPQAGILTFEICHFAEQI